MPDGVRDRDRADANGHPAAASATVDHGPSFMVGTRTDWASIVEPLRIPVTDTEPATWMNWTGTSRPRRLMTSVVS
jgi:hypothetical protein